MQLPFGRLRAVSLSNGSRRLAAVKFMDEKISDTQVLVTPGRDKVIKVGKKFFRVVKA